MGGRREKGVRPLSWQALESIGPPPGLEGCQQPRESPEPPDPRESREPPAPQESPEPPTQGESPEPLASSTLLWTEAPDAMQYVQNMEEKLYCEIAEARRLLWEEGFGVAPFQRSTASSSTEPPVSEVVPQFCAECLGPAPRNGLEPPTQRESPEPPTAGAQLMKGRWEFTALSIALITADAGDRMSLWNLAVRAAHFLGLLEILSHRADRPCGRALTPFEQALQNVVVLALCFGLDEEGLAQVHGQGIPAPLKTLMKIVLQEATNESSGDLYLLLMSRLGVAKYHIFTEGRRFSRRKARIKERMLCTSYRRHIHNIIQIAHDVAEP